MLTAKPMRGGLPEQIHPDAWVDFAVWQLGMPRGTSATVAATTSLCYAAECSSAECDSLRWVLKSYEGHAKNKRKLLIDRPVCNRCGAEWVTWESTEYRVTGARDPGPTRRGRWTRYIRCNPTRAASRVGPEERLFGRLDLRRHQRARELAERFHRSDRWFYACRVYFVYVLRFSSFHGAGGERGATRWALEHFPDAPFAWNRDRISNLIEAGRWQWARMLADAGLIPPGEWWVHRAKDDPKSVATTVFR